MKVLQIKEGKKVWYKYKKSGKEVTDKDTLEYIKSLKIPPAYESVEIDTNPKAELVVVGYDVKGKKQYLYSEKHVQKAKKKKLITRTSL